MLYRIALLDLTSERKGEGKNTHTAGNAQTHKTQVNPESRDYAGSK